MPSQSLNALLAQLPSEAQRQQLEQVNTELATMPPQQRVAWALQELPGQHALSSSFGIQGAVMLHLVTSVKPDTPVILTDTGYLFPETYRFIDELTERLDLNLKVYRSPLTPAWQEARFGQLWEQGQEGLDTYNRLNKVEPMQQALEQLQVGTWFAGLRRQQAQSRAELPFLAIRSGRYKLLPILEWTNKDVHQYLEQHQLPYHPLWHQGYASVGDVHTSRPMELGMSEEDSRFAGFRRECGLHYDI
ncbi:phosphoadenylylsulfate reductase (thioredoxin) [Ferrimonas sediminum]|uniref:Phosphoadenosine 5'-phosphosulfate reductase n=1 Tax=Ferrimonas sediminum TaxID=718193 RepID=A0A1G8MBW8_9GAMM|nr:phosphoadenylyl-sulfate reductase [Ferrimonas sediminum]SDI65393.1 phosphoadenylylsulfate reductase (thioredoxin) [Ferrimonas sediminum]